MSAAVIADHHKAGGMAASAADQFNPSAGGIDCTSFARRTDDGALAMDIAVDGIHCAGCMAAVERGLSQEPGIRRARVNLALKRVTVEWDEAKLAGARILEKLDEIGYPGHPFAANRGPDAEEQETKRLLRCLGVAAFSAMNIMLLSVSVWSGNASDIDGPTRDFFHWVSGIIAIPTAIYAGRPFYESALASIKRRAVNMDVPITLGILLALGMSVVETFNHAEHAYFDSAVMLIFFLLIGRTLDQIMRKRTRDLAANIAALRADTALKLSADGTATLMPIAAIAPGDRVLVRPGDRIGVDGVVASGRSDIDQSLVTGETNHVAVGEGARVYAGTVNVSGTLTVHVTAAQQGTLLDEIDHLMRDATAVRAGYVRLADRAARAYAPIVHATAALTFLGWMLAGLSWSQALIIAITVLIITCPCALGLAIPAVQVVASGALFRTGVLLRAGEALERLAEADVVVFDKTGTLTLPEPELVGREQHDPRLLALAGRLGLASRHPLAQALARASGETVAASDAREEPGQGITALIDGVLVRLGSPDFCDARAQADMMAQAYPDASLIALDAGGQKTVFAIGQRLRPGARETVDRLRCHGLAIEILSGDRESAVTPIAQALGITTFHAGATPKEKIARLDAMRAQGRKVLMVGDGLNDAPALAAAHVSLSPTSASHLSQAAADALFLGESLAPVEHAVRIGRRAKKLMMQNLWFS
ncbi:MAG: heavy metal translocating P-type ATPase, partial [Beijerinckiaceae bacterium]